MKSKSRLFLFTYLIVELYQCSQGASNSTFFCHESNTFYIAEEKFCDGVDNCLDGEDERLGCEVGKKYPCSKGQFTCDSGKCLNVAVRCNTIPECQDATDERDCGDEINVSNCTTEGKFRCKDGLRCLSLKYTCNDDCNCFDCSDENENCSKHDYDLLKRCPHAYFATANGPQCFCENHDAESKRICKSIKECPSYSKYMVHEGRLIFCDQRCIRFENKYQCTCYEEYDAMNGTFGSKCKTSRDFLLLYANENEIKSFNNTSYETLTITRGIANCTLLAAANNYVYYVTLPQNNKGNIFKCSLKYEKPEKLIETDFAITSIAVDYITNNIYFTGNGTLSVCSSNGHICTQIKCCNVHQVNLAPKSGWMYYTQTQSDYSTVWDYRNKFFPVRSNMDGSNETIYKDYYLSSDISIRMDELKNVIYFMDKRGSVKIFKISVNSTFEINREDERDFELHDIKSFSFLNDDIFYTLKWKNDIFYVKNITSEDYISGSKRTRLVYLNDISESPLADIYVYNSTIRRNTENPCEKSSCSGLCLLRPEDHASKFLSHTCLCDGFTPTDDNHWCTSDSNTVVWVFVCVLVLIILCVTGYVLWKCSRQQRSLLMYS